MRSKMPIHPKMYVLVRNDLDHIYKIVQGSHALAQYALVNREIFEQWNNNTIIYLGVRNLKALKDIVYLLNKSKKTFSTFLEPDLDGQLTGIACYDTGEIFKDLKAA